MPSIDPTRDAFGRALVDHLEGRTGAPLVLESDDGTTRRADLQPADFFIPSNGWASWEQRLIGEASGAVLDLGAGAGRHAVHLQELGHEVTAVDISPGAASVCRTRGIRDVRCVDLRDLSGNETWDTILLMCGNLGLGGDWEPTRRLLARLAHLTSPGGVLIGDSVDPTSEAPEDLAYQERNEAQGFHPGHVRLRLHYGPLVTPWWDQLNIAPRDIEGLIYETGWWLASCDGDDDGYGVVLRRS